MAMPLKRRRDYAESRNSGYRDQRFLVDIHPVIARHVEKQVSMR